MDPSYLERREKEKAKKLKFIKPRFACFLVYLLLYLPFLFFCLYPGARYTSREPDSTANSWLTIAAHCSFDILVNSSSFYKQPGC